MVQRKAMGKIAARGEKLGPSFFVIPIISSYEYVMNIQRTVSLGLSDGTMLGASEQ